VIARRLVVLLVVCAGIGVAAYSAAAGHRRAQDTHAPGAPVSLARPVLRTVGVAFDELDFNPQFDQWTSAGSLPLSLSYSWLRCDLAGNHCVPIPGLVGRPIVPPQGLKLFTIRGAVTATDARGSTTAVSSNFYFDHAGIPLEHPGFRQYDPRQLRAWYGLRPGQDGAGETIGILEPERAPHLHPAVGHFSAHYGLPLPCHSASETDCFRLRVLEPAGTPYVVDRGGGEPELDVEWAHAIAPEATIVVLEANRLVHALPAVGRLAHAGRAEVFSSSWSDPPRDRGYDNRMYAGLARNCDLAHTVCLVASGDDGGPGVTPANSPDVLAVGGVTFVATRDDSPQRETGWLSSGGGATARPLPRPGWQHLPECVPTACGKREIPDVSATATGAPTYQVGSPENTGWFVQRGTSLATPLWASLIALADQELARQGTEPIGIGELHAVLCRGYLRKVLDDVPPRGWDLQTGLGSPKSGIVDVLVRAIERYRAGR
jgi:hypothetical protein